MNGEARFNQEIYEVVQEIIRQLLLHNGETFRYAFQSKLDTPAMEQLKILRILDNKKLIELKHHVTPNDINWDDDDVRAMYNDRFEVTASQAKLNAFAEELIPSIEQHGLGDKIICALRLDDLDFKLTVGDYDEQRIGRLHQDRSLYKVMAALSTRPSGTDVNRMEVLPNSKDSNLWQIFVKSKYGYLAPFFKHSKDRISFQPNVELPKAMVLTMISKINEKYRNNFNDIVKDLQR